MQYEGILPNTLIYVRILKAFATIIVADIAWQKGKVHDEIARLGLLQNGIVLGSALVDMYAKSRVV